MNNVKLIEILQKPLKSFKFFFLAVVFISLSTVLLFFQKNTEYEAVCNIKFIAIFDPTGAAIGLPDNRFNNLIDMVGKEKIDDVFMRSDSGKMTILAKGKSISDIRDWFQKNMPTFFKLEDSAAVFYYSQYDAVYYLDKIASSQVLSLDSSKNLNVGVLANSDNILKNIQCFEKMPTISSKSIFVVVIFLSFFFTLALRIADRRISRCFQNRL